MPNHNYLKIVYIPVFLLKEYPLLKLESLLFSELHEACRQLSNSGVEVSYKINRVYDRGKPRWEIILYTNEGIDLKIAQWYKTIGQKIIDLSIEYHKIETKKWKKI